MTAALAPQHGVLRTLRGSGLAAVNTVLAVAAHMAGGGGSPDGALTLLLTLAVAAAGTTLADRRRGPLALLGAVAITQVVLHLLLDGLGGHHPGTVPAPSGVAMTVAHAAAVVVTAALLAGAESALFAVAGVLRRIVRALPPQPAPVPAAELGAPPPATTPLPVALQRLLRRVMPRRGPPRPA